MLKNTMSLIIGTHIGRMQCVYQQLAGTKDFEGIEDLVFSIETFNLGAFPRFLFIKE